MKDIYIYVYADKHRTLHTHTEILKDPNHQVHRQHPQSRRPHTNAKGRLRTLITIWVVVKIRGTFFGVLIIRILVFRGLY